MTILIEEITNLGAQSPKEKEKEAGLFNIYANYCNKHKKLRLEHCSDNVRTRHMHELYSLGIHSFTWNADTGIFFLSDFGSGVGWQTYILNLNISFERFMYMYTVSRYESGYTPTGLSLEYYNFICNCRMLGAVDMISRTANIDCLKD